ncbi:MULTISPECIES: hypothetical protein [Flavobacterium]|uniref:Lipoprotein n=2 Tax=Flavobacterium TaxID=237 RepID=A0A246GN42_9FLAO|nr:MULTISPECIES: hypothetical protein [Flavobacterium]OWP85161.1 hypothetical protein BWK59_01525 [Flavobacterium davisii]RVU91426.1 hypothetical protein EH230_11235 [Flavobacterium columnare]
MYKFKMLEMVSRKLSFLCACLILVSCNKEDSKDVMSDTKGSCESSIPFLKTGKEVVFDLFTFGKKSGTMKMTFGSCNGEGFLVTRNFYNDLGELVRSSVDLMKQEGDFLLVDSDNNKDYFAKSYKKNVQLNEEWKHVRADKAVVTHKVIDLDSVIKVPAGTFHCKVFKFSTTTAINDSYIFWNDDIGNVYEDTGFFKMELKSFK